MTGAKSGAPPRWEAVNERARTMFMSPAIPSTMRYPGRLPCAVKTRCRTCQQRGRGLWEVSASERQKLALSFGGQRRIFCLCNKTHDAGSFPCNSHPVAVGHLVVPNSPREEEHLPDGLVALLPVALHLIHNLRWKRASPTERVR